MSSTAFYPTSSLHFEGGSTLLREFVVEKNLKCKIVSQESELLVDAVVMKSLIWEIKARSEFVVLCLLPEDKVKDTNFFSYPGNSLTLFNKFLNIQVNPTLFARAMSKSTTRKDVCLAERSLAVQKAGCELGTVPPIGHQEQMPVILDVGLVNKLKDYGKYFSAGSGEAGYDLLISLNQILKLDYVSIKPITKNFQEKVDYYILLDAAGKTLKSSFKNNLVAGENETIETRRYQKSSATKSVSASHVVASHFVEAQDTDVETLSGRTILQFYLDKHKTTLTMASIVPSFSERLLDAIFIKSLVFEVKPSKKFVILVLLAEDRVDSMKTAAALSPWGAVTKADVGLASRTQALEATG